MKMPTEQGKILGANEYNSERCHLQDIIDHFDKEGQHIYYFQDPISGHIYFDICNNCDDCWYNSYEDNYSSSKRGKKNKTCENRPCKPDLEPRNPDTDSFTSLRSKLDGYQILSQWMTQILPTPKQTLHPYYKKCLSILK